VNESSQEIIKPGPYQAVPAISESAAIIQVIERVALNPDIDVSKMQQLLAMQIQILDRQAAEAYARAMMAAQAEMPRVIVNKQNAQTSSRYADLEAVNRAVTPIATKHGFSISFDTDRSALDNHVLIVATVLHSGGHHKAYNYDAPLDDAGIAGKINKTPTHARASSISYGQRYLLKLIFNLTIAGEDNDGNGSTDERGVNVEAIKEMGRKEVRDQFAAYQELVRTYILSIVAIKNGIATNQYSIAAEAWYELDEEIQRGLWVATSKGGIFTTSEREVMKKTEFREAYYGAAA